MRKDDINFAIHHGMDKMWGFEFDNTGKILYVHESMIWGILNDVRHREKGLCPELQKVAAIEIAIDKMYKIHLLNMQNNT